VVVRPTLEWLLKRRELGLRPLADGADLSRPVRWVHVSELDDPTPFLSGGELLLTAGRTPQDWGPYVERLVAGGLAGLGFGVGLGHEEVPAALVAAARRAGLPLLRVPVATPFIAIGEAVAAAIAGERERTLAAALDTQRELIAASLSRGGPRAMLDALARALGCWCLVLDEACEPRHCSPPAARRHAARLRLDLDRLGLDSPLRSASLDLGGDQVAVLPIGPDGRVAGHLVAGRPERLSPSEHSVLTSAAGLLSLELAFRREALDAHRQARLAVLRLLAGEHPDLAGATAATLGIALPAEPVRVALLGTDPGGVADLLRAAENHQALSQASALVAGFDRHSVVVLVPVAEGDRQALEEVLHQVPCSRGVVTEGVPLSGLAEGLRRARSVFLGARGTGAGRLLLARDVATAGLLAQLDTPGARAWAETLLEPLERHAGRSKLDLISTLRVFLARNGQVDASAHALGIHRHTLRYRLRRVTELLGSDLDDPTVRAELWLALRMHAAR
jgi:purine catabolism regulator